MEIATDFIFSNQYNNKYIKKPIPSKIPNKPISKHIMKSGKITFNGIDRFDYKNDIFFNYVQHL